MTILQHRVYFEAQRTQWADERRGLSGLSQPTVISFFNLRPVDGCTSETAMLRQSTGNET
jgi:hypothetical protein